jgi:hypothetical protein
MKTETTPVLAMCHIGLDFLDWVLFFWLPGFGLNKKTYIFQ